MGNPVAIVLTAGQEADVTQAEMMIEARDADAYIADKASESEKVVRTIQEKGAEAVIPPKANRKQLRDYDKHLYKERTKEEWFINLIKQFRRVATRYEKTGRNFLAFVHVASIMVLLR